MTASTASVAWLTAPRKIEFRDEPLRSPSAGEILCETIVSAISPGTELAEMSYPGNPIPSVELYPAENIARVVDAIIDGMQARSDRLEPGEHAGEVRNDPVLQSATLWFDDGMAGHIDRATRFDFMLSCERGSVSVLNDGHQLAVAEDSSDNPYRQRRIVEDYPRASLPQGIAAPIRELKTCLEGDAAAIRTSRGTKQAILLGQSVAFASIASHRSRSGIVALDEIEPETVLLALTNGRPALIMSGLKTQGSGHRGRVRSTTEVHS